MIVVGSIIGFVSSDPLIANVGIIDNINSKQEYTENV